MTNLDDYLKKERKLQRILKVEVFFRNLADLVAYPFRAVAHKLHLKWVKEYERP